MVIPIAVILNGLFLYLLFILYRRFADRFDANKTVARIKKESFRSIRNVDKWSRRYAGALQIRSDSDPIHQDQMAKAASFVYLEPVLKSIQSKIEFLFQFYDRYRSVGEKTLADSILLTICEILIQYFKSRKDSSLLIPTEVLVVPQSDSHWFIIPILENFQARGRTLAQENDGQGITLLMELMVRLSYEAERMRYLPKTQAENPIFAIIRGYLDTIIDATARHHHVEGLFQGAKSYGKLGVKAIEGNLDHDLESILDKLMSICVTGVRLQSFPIWKEAIQSFLETLTFLMSNLRYDYDQRLKSIFQKLAMIYVMIMQMETTGRIHTGVYSDLVMSRLFEIIPKFTDNMLRQCKEASEGSNKSQFITGIMQLADIYRAFLRELAEDANTADSLVIRPIGISIKTMCLILFNVMDLVTDQEDKREMDQRLRALIHSPYWFVRNAEVRNSYNMTQWLLDPLVTAGVVFIRGGSGSLAIEVSKVATSMAESLLERIQEKEIGFSEPRAMVPVCLLGIVAMKHGNLDVIHRQKELIKSFENKYKEKWFPNDEDIGRPSPNRLQLMNELMRFRASFMYKKLNYPHQLLNSTEALIYRSVEESDIDAYGKEIWDGWPTIYGGEIKRP